MPSTCESQRGVLMARYEWQSRPKAYESQCPKREESASLRLPAPLDRPRAFPRHFPARAAAGQLSENANIGPNVACRLDDPTGKNDSLGRLPQLLWNPALSAACGVISDW